MRKHILFITIIFLISLFSFSCKSTDKRTSHDKKDVTEENTNNNESNTQAKDEEVVIDVDKGIQKHKEVEEFFSEEKRKHEVFRIFMASDTYLRKQLSYIDTIKMKEDDLGDKGSPEDLKKFDKIDYKVKAVVKIELYPDTGGISRVRFASPSGLGEIDKIISEDITRLEFEFPKKVISPRNFTITYMILLQNKISREEAIKELKKFTDKKH